MAIVCAVVVEGLIFVGCGIDVFLWFRQHDTRYAELLLYTAVLLRSVWFHFISLCGVICLLRLPYVDWLWRLTE
jgi:hypothetical protein